MHHTEAHIQMPTKFEIQRSKENPMIELRPFAKLGGADHGWLKAKHHFSFGSQGRTEAGDVQVMSAGSGVRHSEYNLEPTRTKIFQIWIEPTTEGGQPTWGAKPFPKSDRSGNFVTIASGFDG